MVHPFPPPYFYGFIGTMSELTPDNTLPWISWITLIPLTTQIKDKSMFEILSGLPCFTPILSLHPEDNHPTGTTTLLYLLTLENDGIGLPLMLGGSST